MKRLLPLLFLPFIFCSCAQPPPAALPPEEKRPTIAFVYKALSNPYFISMSAGAKRAAREENVLLLERACSNEEQINEQIAIMQELIAMKVSGICLSPISPFKLVDVVKAAQNENIPTITVGSRLDPAAAQAAALQTLAIKSDNTKAQHDAMRTLLRQARKPLKILLIEGIPGSASSEERKLGFFRAISEQPQHLVVKTDSGYWRADKGYLAAKAAFEEDPSINMVCALNDLMALGALQYLQESGRSDIILLGFDGIAEAREAIRSGAMTASIIQQSEEFGYLSVKLLVRKLRGESVPALTILDTKLIQAGDL